MSARVGLGGDAALAVGTDGEPVAVERSTKGIVIPIPAAMRQTRTGIARARAAIACTFSRPQSTATTFTERSVTVQADTNPPGAVLLDISALESIDDLRFSGGAQVPFGGDRARLAYGDDNIVSAEWSDVLAQEQRDIVLVIVGALSAIAAAMVIEAIRPTIQSRSRH
jgi:hypothetical protein